MCRSKSCVGLRTLVVTAFRMPRKPAGYGFDVPLIGRPELPLQGRLLVKHHEQEEAAKHDCGVDQNNNGLEEERFSEKDRRDADVHWVTHMSVESPDDKFLGRIKRGGRSTTGNEKIPGTPEVGQATQEDRDETHVPEDAK